MEKVRLNPLGERLGGLKPHKTPRRGFAIRQPLEIRPQKLPKASYCIKRLGRILRHVKRKVLEQNLAHIVR